MLLLYCTATQVAHDLEMLAWPGKPWVQPMAAPAPAPAPGTQSSANGHVYDVVVVGGGQVGRCMCGSMGKLVCQVVEGVA